MRCIIGIGGLRRSGKDTFARALCEVAMERGLAFATVAFADPLRQAAAAAYGVDVGVFTDDAKKDTVCPEWGITYRQMLLNLGVPATLLGGDHDHWVKRWRVEVAKLPEKHYQTKVNPWVTGTYHDVIVAVPDVRRLNEAAVIHDAGGVNVLVQRPGVEWNGHVTEALAHLAAQHGTCSYDFLSYVPALKQGTWHPTDPVRGDAGREVFDTVVCNDSDVAAMRPHAERVLDMILKGAK